MSWEDLPRPEPRWRKFRPLGTAVVAALLVSSIAATGTWAALTATDKNANNTWTVGQMYFLDSAGTNATKVANYTTGKPIATSAPTIPIGSKTTLTYYIKLQFNNSDGNSASSVTLTPTWKAVTGTPTEADMDLFVQAGTGCTNLSVGSATDAKPSTTCTGGFTPFATGADVIGTSATSTTFTAASGVAAPCDGSSGTASWANGGADVTFEVEITPNGSETAGGYGLSFLWTATTA